MTLGKTEVVFSLVKQRFCLFFYLTVTKLPEYNKVLKKDFAWH